MRRLTVICLMLLAGCGRDLPPPVVPADLLEPVPGWTGPSPKTKGALMAASLAEKRGLGQCNIDKDAIREILQGV
jgi:hypothetical protein